ncbi:MAG: hypothetical protein A4S14_14010 [Proteobacteria bacterium SG_bin9]|nr:MAG: hypothetical protein A4S14_14010 [Proteobacteria bacterium SG_bin9]
MAAINERMTTGTLHIDNRESGIFAEMVAFFRQFIVAAFNPYRPELHYMRGPGPAWRAKHGQPTR